MLRTEADFTYRNMQICVRWDQNRQPLICLEHVCHAIGMPAPQSTRDPLLRDIRGELPMQVISDRGRLRKALFVTRDQLEVLFGPPFKHPGCEPFMRWYYKEIEPRLKPAWLNGAVPKIAQPVRDTRIVEVEEDEDTEPSIAAAKCSFEIAGVRFEFKARIWRPGV